ncbi:hypothetical protein ACFRAE_06965 [Sphingobacterium sp. HJSM2_6]|uniref:hypothetical protein n=1 Tax=Sphingobacterium sp. HJSM2_6 TaxID=3366264 RepID=UPI003BD7691F
MPANKKYLSGPWQRLLKITAGVFAGYGLMLSFHLMLTVFIPKKYVVISAGISGYLLWAILLLIALLSVKGWKIWLIYSVLSLLFYIVFILN